MEISFWWLRFLRPWKAEIEACLFGELTTCGISLATVNLYEVGHAMYLMIREWIKGSDQKLQYKHLHLE